MANIYWDFIAGFVIGGEFISNYDETGRSGLLLNLGIISILVEFE